MRERRCAAIDERAIWVRGGRSLQRHPSQLIDAFIHPPTLVGIAHRFESDTGRVRIVSHIELWPWRLVVRGLHAEKSAAPSGYVAPLPPDPEQTSGGVVVETVTSDPDAVARVRDESIRFATWRIEDDIGTEYRSIESGWSGGPTWWDFDLEFQPGVPLAARHITISPPDGDVITVRVST